MRERGPLISRISCISSTSHRSETPERYGADRRFLRRRIPDNRLLLSAGAPFKGCGRLGAMWVARWLDPD